MTRARTIWLAAAVAMCVGSGCQAPAPASRPAAPLPPSLGGVDLFEQAELIDNVHGTASGVTLARGVLIEDDAAAFGLFDPQAEPGRVLRRQATGPADTPYFQPITRTVWARKLLLIGPLSARSASLVFYAARSGTQAVPLIVQVNGGTLRFDPPPGPQADRPQWRELSVPVSLLQSGENEIILRGEGGAPGWLVLISPREQFARGSLARRIPPVRSFRSHDGGASWQAGKLGPDGSVQGEFAVRLWLDQYLLQGQWTGPVMDLASDIDSGPISRVVRFARADGRIEQEVPSGGRIGWQIRTGSLRAFTAAAWGKWQDLAVDGEGRFKVADIGDRYVQLRASLSTGDPSLSPLIRSLRMSGAEPQAAAVPPGLLRVLEFRNRRVLGSAVDFAYDAMPNPRLNALDQRFALAGAVRRSRTQFERAVDVLGWLAAAGRRGLFVPGPSWRAGEILSTQTREPTQSLPYQLVLCQALLRQGIVARVVLFAAPGAGAPRREEPRLAAPARSATEFWSNDFEKWVLMDGESGRYFIDADSAVPLGGLELHDRLIRAGFRWAGEPLDDAAGGPTAGEFGLRVVTPQGILGDEEAVGRWPAGLPLLIPRNNFATVDRPTPLNPESSGAGWSDYVAWGDSPGPRPGPWIARSVTRRRDFNWTLNQTQMEVRYGQAPGELWVYLHSQTPSFQSFQVNVDGTGWKAVPAEFHWLLVPGPNRLEVRTRSAADVAGPASLMHVLFFPTAPPGK